MTTKADKAKITKARNQLAELGYEITELEDDSGIKIEGPGVNITVSKDVDDPAQFWAGVLDGVHDYQRQLEETTEETHKRLAAHSDADVSQPPVD